MKLTLCADASYRDGRAGIGVAVWSERGTLVGCFHCVRAAGSSNEAEILGAEVALQYARERQAEAVVLTDCEGVLFAFARRADCVVRRAEEYQIRIAHRLARTALES